ncbi:MAG: hypothetical protein H3C27_13550 [Opitutaceae bacterium]|nr:hypothetical protein [Opitutaceae bacterium]
MPGCEAAYNALRRPVDSHPASPPSGSRKTAAPAPDLDTELQVLQALTSDADKLQRCEQAISDCATALAGTSQVLRGALHMAYVGRHDLWRLPRDADGAATHPSLTAYCTSFLGHVGAGASKSRISRLLQVGHLGLDLHGVGLALPTTAEPLRTVLDSRPPDPLEVCRELISRHHGRFPNTRDTEAYLATLPKSKTTGAQSSHQGWHTHVLAAAREGLVLAQSHAPYPEIEAVFRRLEVLAESRLKSPSKKTNAANPA